MKEDLKVSEEYKKAYNQADMICSYMPHLLKDIQAPDKTEPSAYTQGFKDRVEQHEIEQDAIRNFSYEQLHQKYGPALDNYGKDKIKNRTRERE